MRILTVCSANRCRSPMAAGLLRTRLAGRGFEAQVASAGLGPAGLAAVPDAVDVMADVGIDIRAHRSRQVTPEVCAGADLVLAMTRQHVVELVVLSPGAWPHTFMLREALERARGIGPRRPGEEPSHWIERMHDGRRRAAILSAPSSIDVADPIGQPRRAFVQTRRELEGLVEELTELLAPRPARRAG
jgi:protein-tyrosine phosphatase